MKCLLYCRHSCVQNKMSCTCFLFSIKYLGLNVHRTDWDFKSEALDKHSKYKMFLKPRYTKDIKTKRSYTTKAASLKEWSSWTDLTTVLQAAKDAGEFDTFLSNTYSFEEEIEYRFFYKVPFVSFYSRCSNCW